MRSRRSPPKPTAAPVFSGETTRRPPARSGGCKKQHFKTSRGSRQTLAEALEKEKQWDNRKCLSKVQNRLNVVRLLLEGGRLRLGLGGGRGVGLFPYRLHRASETFHAHIRRETEGRRTSGCKIEGKRGRCAGPRSGVKARSLLLDAAARAGRPSLRVRPVRLLTPHRRAHTRAPLKRGVRF